MKSITILSILATGSILAGEKAVIDESPYMPPAPSLYGWFAGGTVGYLFENETEMYTGHLGIDLPNQLGGWDQSLYLEVGYFEFDDCANYPYQLPDPQGSNGFEYNDFESIWAEYGRACFEVEVIPVTLNYKLEKPLTTSLNVYLGGGAGVAFTDAEADIGPASDDDDDTVFYAQLFAGLLYNVNPTFELYAGARVIYMDDPEYDLFGADVDFEDLGGENTDYLVEVGGRVNF